MSTKPSNLANPVVETTIDQAMIAKKKPSQKRIPPVRKQTRGTSTAEKKSPYAQDCHNSTLNKKKPIESFEEVKRTW